MGGDVFSGDVTNMLEKGVIEPVWVKQQALKSAAEVASMILPFFTSTFTAWSTIRISLSGPTFILT
jgi:hypothetical protein